MTFAISAFIFGVMLALLIFYLLRRDHVYLRDALFWLSTALASVIFAIFPSLVDLIGRAAGVQYPPALVLAIVCAVLTVKALMLDIALTSVRRDLRRLNQRMALLDRGSDERQDSSLSLGVAAVNDDHSRQE
jgi:hypothetical protein